MVTRMKGKRYASLPIKAKGAPEDKKSSKVTQ